MNFRLARPQYLIDLNRIPELAYIREENGRLAIGAMTRQRAVERPALVRERCPLLAEAMPHRTRHRGAHRGVAQSAVSCVMKRVMDLTAQRTGLDPAQVRMTNMIQPGEFPYVNVLKITYDSASFVESLRRALGLVEYQGLREAQQRG